MTYGVRIEDDGTRVIGNTFEADDPTHHAIIVGTEFRTTVLDHPCATPVVEDNHAAIAGNDDPYRWIHGYDGLRVHGNTSHGDPTASVRGNSRRDCRSSGRSPRRWSPRDTAAGPADPGGPSGAGRGRPVPRARDAASRARHGDRGRERGRDHDPDRAHAPTDRTVTATWQTATLPRKGWVELGVDVVVEKHGTVELDPGETLTHIEIHVIDDDVAEDDEVVIAWFQSVDGARPGGFYGLGSARSSTTTDQSVGDARAPGLVRPPLQELGDHADGREVGQHLRRARRLP